MISVFVDTSALLPLVDRRNVAHEVVVAALDGLTARGARLVTSNYVLVEAGALVRKRLGVQVLRALGAVVDASMHIVWVDEALHRRAWERAAADARRGPSLVDWAAFLVMKDLGIEVALTLDAHFREQGFETLPEPPVP